MTAARVRSVPIFAAAILIAVPLAMAQTQEQTESQEGIGSPPQIQVPAQADQAVLDTGLDPLPDRDSEAAQALSGPRPIAVLQGLNKTTARVSTIEVPIGADARFGTLEITARACEKKPPTEPPESAAYLEIVDVRPDSPSVAIFSGWMFASSPAISALEHPVYDVWVIDCRPGGGASAMAPLDPIGAGGNAADLPETEEGDTADPPETDDGDLSGGPDQPGTQ